MIPNFNEAPLIFLSDLTGKSEDPVETENARTFVNEQIVAETAKKIKAESVPFTEKETLFIAALKNYFQTYFAELGIQSFHWPQFIFQVKSVEKWAPGAYFGASIPGIVLVSNEQSSLSVPFIHQDLIALLRTKRLAHELYHASGQYVLELNGQNISPVRSGLNYLKPSSSQETALSAFEEGLATKVERQIEPLLQEFFPGGKSLYDELRKQSSSIHNIPYELIDIVGFDGYRVASNPIYYKNSVDLVNFISQIPNFYKLVEQARTRHFILPLARALAERFGKGSYRKIMETTTDQAEDLLREYKQLL